MMAGLGYLELEAVDVGPGTGGEGQSVLIRKALNVVPGRRMDSPQGQRDAGEEHVAQTDLLCWLEMELQYPPPQTRTWHLQGQQCHVKCRIEVSGGSTEAHSRNMARERISNNSTLKNAMTFIGDKADVTRHSPDSVTSIAKNGRDIMQPLQLAGQLSNNGTSWGALKMKQV